MRLAVPLLLTTGAAASCQAPSTASPGCTSLPPGFKAGALSSPQMTSSGRTYQVYVPESHSSPLPLILSFHGAGGTIASQSRLDLLTNSEFAGKTHLVAYLQGTADDPSDPGRTTWEGAPKSTSDDLGFVGDVLDALEDALCVDRSRIYATGKSQGGGFVNRLACDGELSKRIAAFAPVAGAYYVPIDVAPKSECTRPVVGLDLDKDCAPARDNIPLLAFHGGDDGTINITGGWRSGKCLPGVRSWVGQWVERDGLDLEADADDSDDINGSTNGVVSSWGKGLVKYVYAGDEVGHDWMATIENKDNANSVPAAFNATEWILDFFKGVVLEL